MAILVQSTQPYRLRMACGHVEIRMMREETAGVIFSPDIVIEVSTSQCAECEPSKAEMREMQRGLNARHGL